MPTKLILLAETLMELAQGFHKQNLIDQRDIERWDLKLSQHDPTCTVLVLSCYVWYGHIRSYMSIYDTIWLNTDGYEWMTCLQILATRALLKTAEREAFRCPFSGVCGTRTANKDLPGLKTCKTCLLCISKLMSAEKTCKKWLNKYGSPVGSVDSVDSSAFLILPFPFSPPEQQQGA